MNLGDIFHVKGTANYSSAAIRMDIPTVFWLEGNSDTLYAAEWNGTKWNLVGQASLNTGYFLTAKTATTGSKLYLAQNIYDWKNYIISVDQRDGTTWTTLNDILRSSSSSQIYTFDVTIYKGMAVVAFVENNTLKVEMYSTSTSVKEIPVVSDYSLSQNFPNPFNPVTSIEYSLPKCNYVSLKVYDMLGREIETLADGQKGSGLYRAIFDGSRFASGVYSYVLRAGNKIIVKKMLLIK